MKREMFVIVGLVVLVSLVIAGVAITYPSLWRRTGGTEQYFGNVVGQGMMGYGPTGNGTMGYGPMGYGMMGNGMMGQGMTGGMGMMSIYTADSRPVNESDARVRAQVFASRYYPGSTIGDFMEFSLNYYAEIKDASNTSIAEILVDRFTGTVTPEPGPNMMWNTGYQSSRAAVTYDLNGSRSLAETFLAGYLPGATIEDSISYPGYYTFDFGRETNEGMLSVNAFTGSIWVHTWHGQYIGG